ncbi:MAG: hypothetical protein Q4D02_01220 [Clostridia bacterium]|nr:hypothetical protein [Clostridia bacterium]
MDFVKGAVIGIVAGTMAGTIIGVMNDDSIMQMFKKGKKEAKKLRKKYSF